MWLPAVVGPTQDENWCNVLRITTYQFALKITSDEANYLEILSEQHHETFYSDESITPKFHYMVHMPRLIKKFDLQHPLVMLSHVSCRSDGVY